MIKSEHWNSIIFQNVVIERDKNVWLTKEHQIIIWKMFNYSKSNC